MKILSGIAEGQVLQRLGARGATARLVVADAEAGPVTVTVAGARGALKGWKNRVIGTSKGGEFKTTLVGIPAGGPYWFEMRAGQAVARLRAFYVGDVWLMAGQSNMAGAGDMTGRARPDPLIRAFSMRREWRLATDPLHVPQESPDLSHAPKQCTPAEGEKLRRTAAKGVGVGMFFAREMLRRTKVPQGLIATSRGGASMRQWDPELKGQGGDSLYGSMLLSMRATDQPVAGMLWYQGESETNDTDSPLYTERMIKLVAAVRRDLRQPALPWIMVQIARIYVFTTHPHAGWINTPHSWNSVQEQQRRLPEKIRNLETVAAIDLPLDDLVHLGSAGYPRLGLRMARMADRLVHGDKSEKRPPQLVSVSPMKIRASVPGGPKVPVIDVNYSHVVGGFKCSGEPEGFALVDGKGRSEPVMVRTTFHGGTIRLHLPTEALLTLENAALSYGHGLAPRCNITDGRDYSLPVFRPIVLGKPVVVP